jgi:L-iditol 2-dehydrogenase
MKSVVLGAAPGGRGYLPQLKDLEDPQPGQGEIVVAMKACGLCGTDLEKMRGGYTASLPVVGHEAVGVVTGLGERVKGLRVGDRVFPHHHVPDHECYLCRAGDETMCERYRSTNLDPGGFSEYFRVPEWNVSKGGVLRLPDSMSYEVGSLIEPLACCVRASKKCRVGQGETVLVAGAGPVGLLHCLVLKPTGAKILASDVSESRLRFAERSGVTAVNAATEDVPRRVAEETSGRGADLAIVASGSRDAIVQGLKSIRKGGRVCLFGVPSKGSILDYDVSDLVNSELEVFASNAATEEDTKAAMKMLGRRGSEFASLVTHRFRLEEFGKAVEAASGGTAMKVVVTP